VKSTKVHIAINERRIRQQAQSLYRTQFHRSIRNPQHNQTLCRIRMVLPVFALM
jgi:hypothetical protein